MKNFRKKRDHYTNKAYPLFVNFLFSSLMRCWQRKNTSAAATCQRPDNKLAFTVKKELRDALLKVNRYLRLYSLFFQYATIQFIIPSFTNKHLQ